MASFEVCGSRMPRAGAHCVLGTYNGAHARRSVVGRLPTAVKALLGRMQSQYSVLRSTHTVFL